MDSMFSGCYYFRSDLSRWAVGSLVSASKMFYMCDDFNSELDDWDVSNLEDATKMFLGAKSFSPATLNSWNVSKLERLGSMLQEFCAVLLWQLWCLEVVNFR